jgi:HD-GYP domain-containing protein (c-di-GMP phosphodiesterase class II)
MDGGKVRRGPSGEVPVPRRSTAPPLPTLIAGGSGETPSASHPSLLSAFRGLDGGTRLHLRRVSHLAGELAAVVGLAPAAQRQASAGGLLHDIGKSVVPGAILYKPTSLTPDETALLRLHPLDGEALAWGTGDPVVLDAIRHHHERLDGRGYPDGLRGDGIPAVTRVVAVADVYDALTSERPYRAALTTGEALRHLAELAGTQLDDTVVEALVLLQTGVLSRAA